MRAIVQNFRGIHTAEIEASPIALLCGQNGQGKSSIIEALGALLDGNPRPYGLTKDSVDRLIHRGEDTGKVEIMDEGRGMTVSWPSGDISTEGAPFRATKFATGSLIYSEMNERDRMTTLAEYLKTAPTKDELTAELKDKVVSGEIADIWADIQKLGWDGAFEKQKTEGTKLKGAWEQITKGRYGSKVGATWRPDGWTDDHEACQVEELKAEQATAEKGLEEAIGKVAINAEEKAKHQALTNNIPKLKEMLSARETEGKRVKATMEKAEAAVKKIPVLPKEHWPECPHCKTPLQVLAGDQLRVAPKPMDGKERQRIELELEEATRIFNEAMAVYDENRRLYDVIRKDLDAAEKSRETLESSDAAVVDPAVIQDFRDEVARCKSILGAKERIRLALVAHMAVQDKAALVGVLAPEGLRKVKLTAKMATFNESLGELCEIASWAHVQVLDDGTLQYGQTAYAMCSGGERMRADVIMQIAFGMRDGSEVFLIDEADILDSKGRNGLFTLLQHTEKKAFVAMMLLGRKSAPDLEKAGFGKTFWIEDAASHDIAA